MSIDPSLWHEGEQKNVPLFYSEFVTVFPNHALCRGPPTNKIQVNL